MSSVTVTNKFIITYIRYFKTLKLSALFKNKIFCSTKYLKCNSEESTTLFCRQSPRMKYHISVIQSSQFNFDKKEQYKTVLSLSLQTIYYLVPIICVICTTPVLISPLIKIRKILYKACSVVAGHLVVGSVPPTSDDEGVIVSERTGIPK